MHQRLRNSAAACIHNGRRLLDDAEFLEYSDPPATAHFLALIAQEEFAKGFLLALVVRGVIPWDVRLLRAAKDHTCKQLLGVVMDFLNPGFDEFKDRCDAVVLRHESPSVPQRVADAINILRHEKLGRWIERSWVWAEDPEYSRDAAAIAAGRQDRAKQNVLYVRLARDGGVAGVPGETTVESVRAERERARRLADLTEGMLAGHSNPGLDYEIIEEMIRTLFESLPQDA